MLECKKNKDTDYVLSRKSNREYTSKFTTLHNSLLHSIKFYENKVRIKFDKDPLAVENIMQPKLLMLILSMI